MMLHTTASPRLGNLENVHRCPPPYRRCWDALPGIQPSGLSKILCEEGSVQLILRVLVQLDSQDLDLAGGEVSIVESTRPCFTHVQLFPKTT